MNINDSREINVSLATTETQRRSAYRLRYAVFTEEEGDQRFADHDQKAFIDTKDNSSSYLLIATNNHDETIGTLRLDFRRDAPFLSDHIYRFDLLAVETGCTLEQVLDRTGLVTRGVVRKDYRGSGVFSQMIASADQLFREHTVTLIVGAIKSENRRSKAIFGQWGYAPYAVSRGGAPYEMELFYRKLAENESSMHNEQAWRTPPQV